MAILNNTQLIQALTAVSDKAAPLLFQQYDGIKYPPTYVDDSLDGLVEVHIDAFNEPLTTEVLISKLKEDKILRGENYITAWNDDGDRLEIQRVETTEDFTLVHLCDG